MKFVSRISMSFVFLFFSNIAISKNASFQSLGDLTGGDFSSCAYCLSADGSVVAGQATTGLGWAAFVWTQNTGMVALGNFPDHSLKHSWPIDISADGSVIVGWGNTTSEPYNDEGQRGFIWTEKTGMTWIGDRNRVAHADGVSADGKVVVGTIEGQAFRWSQDEGLQMLGILEGCNYSSATAVSDDGEIITGSCSKVMYEDEVTFIWTRDSGMKSLGYLPGDVYSFPNAISPDGSVIAGSSYDKYMRESAYRWTEETGMVKIDHLPGREVTHPTGVTSFGKIIVGGSFKDMIGAAFIWDAAQGTRNLQSVLQSDYNLNIEGWALRLAYEISHDGNVIVGSGINSSGNEEAFRIVLDTTVSDAEQSIQPSGFELKQNYPNPFNPSTHIQYSLEKSAQINLSIYNIFGQRVKTLVDAFQNTGEQTLVWDGTDANNNPVSSGIYIYQMKANDQILQRKMLLVR